MAMNTRDEDEDLDDENDVVSREDNVLRMQLVVAKKALLPLPPPLSDLAGCSPSYLTCKSPAATFTFPDNPNPMADSITHQDETLVFFFFNYLLLIKFILIIFNLLIN